MQSDAIQDDTSRGNDAGHSYPLPSPEAWGRFVSALHVAASMQVSAEWLKEDPLVPADTARKAIGHALNALLEMLHSVPELRADTLHLPFITLTAALTNVESGLRPALFEPRGKPRAPIAAQFTMVLAAMAVDACMECGESREQAARKVARIIIQSKLPTGTAGRAPLWKTVLDFRARLAEGPGGRAPQYALEQWARYRRNPEQCGATPEARAATLLDALTKRGFFFRLL
ncbi:MAG: hypothetical protein QJR07_17685 [Acetobacteraceae bacterium]|nr:hypothetical protein [Acetobacteraceae bacterium]